MLASATALMTLCCPMAIGAAQLRIASLNLCTDSMLFELAEPEQIISVTALSRDEDLSYFADQAQHVPINRGLAEEIISLDPDLVLAGRYTATVTNALLSRLGYRVVTFEPALSLADFRLAFLRLAEIIGKRDKAIRLLAAMDNDLQRVIPRSRPSRPRAIIYRPNGFSPGMRSLANDMLNAAGIVNLAEDFGMEYGGFIPLEQLVVAAPDIVLLGGRAQRYPALAELILAHPAIGKGGGTDTGRWNPERVDIAEKYWTCGGTFVVEAIKRLALLVSR